MSDSKTPEDVIQIAADELSYQPSDAMRKVKSAFWLRVTDNPMVDPSETLSLATVKQFVTDKRLDRWWGVYGFKEWFGNRNEFQDRVEYLSQKVLSRLEDMLDDPEAADNAIVSASKILLDMARKTPDRAAAAGSSVLLGKIADMNAEQLEEFIVKTSKKLIG